MLELDFLARHVRGLSRRVLCLRERGRFAAHADFDAGDSREKGHDSQQDDLGFEFHR